MMGAAEPRGAEADGCRSSQVLVAALLVRSTESCPGSFCRLSIASDY